MRPTKSHQSLLVRIVKAPMRALGRARDFYVRSMGSCASSGGYGSAGNPLPRSFSSAGSARLDTSDDFMELLRAASMKSLGNDPLEALLKELKSAPNAKAPASKMSKSCSVGMGRIDEENASEFTEDGGHDQDPKPKELNMYARRSRSYADAGIRSKIEF
ncbi:hypothetical protein SAY87_031497 [Trapa incisa]|uniref:Uncharacterized protein n=1 Tax=Trapa incisa TaxID=236973 RepID=A0AAN7KW52_9MYRT|nr:hypothetical protein SAY87_031497 [Trapa incisa]